uniref:RNA-binding protein 12 n=1 Tax=Cacopsylla melanoneura TaxID=428564 RepID=A0A8D9E0M7_9HEMI
MSVIIRLQNLPWSANSMDIRNYFQGLSIPEGGVHIVGGEQGDAFIAFSTDEDARQAMAHDGGKIKEVKIKLLLSSRSEMQKVIEQARQTSMNFQTMIQTPPVVPVMNQQPLTTPNPMMGHMTQVQPTPAAQPAPPLGQQAATTAPAAQNQTNFTQQALAQKDWQGMAAMGMPAQPMGVSAGQPLTMPGMIPGMPGMPPNALSMMGLMPGLPAQFIQMAQMGLLGPNPMAMAANFFTAAQKMPGAQPMPGQPGATDTPQQTSNVHPVFSNNQFLPGGPTGNAAPPMGGPGLPPNAMAGNFPFNQMPGGPGLL